MGAPQSGADIYRDGKKMRAAPKERTRKEYGRRLTAGGNARAPQSGAEAEPPQSGGHIGKGIWTAQQRRDIFGMGPLANRQSGYSYRNGKKMRAARQQRATYCKGNESGPACKAGTLREDMGRSANSRRIPNLKESGSGSPLPYIAKCILLHPFAGRV